MVMTFLVSFTVTLGVGINIIHLLQIRALRFKEDKIAFPWSMKMVGLRLKSRHEHQKVQSLSYCQRY